MTIREAIKKALDDRRISQRQVALDAGIDYKNFNKYLNGKRPFPLQSLQRIMEVLGLEIRYKEDPENS